MKNLGFIVAYMIVAVIIGTYAARNVSEADDIRVGIGFFQVILVVILLLNIISLLKNGNENHR